MLLAGVDWDPAERSPGANYHFLTSAVAPRPVAWITTVPAAGQGPVNLAPFSWFQAVCADPPIVMLSLADRPDGGPKDTLRNLLATGECVVHVAPAAHAEAIVASSAAYRPEQGEADALGLATTPSQAVAPPRLADLPVALECRLADRLRLGDRSPVTMVLLEVVHVHADDAVLDDRGNVRADAVGFLARLGGRHYATVQDTYELASPPPPPEP